MRKLFVIDKQDYDASWPKTIRKAARAIIRYKNKFYFVKSKSELFYKFPGGGKKRDERIIECLKREVKEEVGLTIIDKSIKDYGYVLEIRKSKRKENTIFYHYSYYFFADVEENTSDLNLDDYERCLCYERSLVSLKDAYLANNSYNKNKAEFEYIIREERVMKLLLEEI